MAQRWCIIKDSRDGILVRRWNKGKYERLPKAKYKGLSLEELEKFVKRLNAPIDAKQRVAFKHAFIDEALLSEYENFLTSRVPTGSEVRRELEVLKTHFLNFFIGKLDLPNPLDWHKDQAAWSKYLIKHKTLRSAKSKRRAIQAANRFIQWLHEKRPEEVPSLKLEPIGRAVFKEIEARREISGEITVRQYIPDEHWEAIKESLPQTILPFALLAYHYGLRRGEVLGLIPTDIKVSCLKVERQLARLTPDIQYKPLKGREVRKIPHWFATAAICYKWIESSQELKIHPDTLTKAWHKAVLALGFNYDFHDLRHTFITKAIRNYVPVDVQQAAGHKNIETTMNYLHDDRDLSEEVFVPESA